MKRIALSVIITLLFLPFSFAQNVGIGNPNPQEKLDVSGNINLTGTIKANGVAGQAGQVLRSNSSGNVEWADFSQYSNFTMVGTGTWVVPSGVTKIFIEVWGGGGGASCHGGGGGGGYIAGIFTVTQGNNVSTVIGSGGVGGCGSGANGQLSSVTVNGITLQALGGNGSVYNPTSKTLSGAYGGSFALVGANDFRYRGVPGSPGVPNTYQYMQSGTSIIEAVHGGSGGNSGNSSATGGRGGYSLQDFSTFARMKDAEGTNGIHGGGGGAGTEIGFTGASSGGSGLVIIRY